jgi:SAM-dependent methyltransferase
MSVEQPDYVSGNVAAWENLAADYVAPAEKAWASADASWGIWGIPDSELSLLPADLSGKDCIELGCGAGYVSAWMARRGGRVTGIDPTSAQLATAERLNTQYGLGVTFELGIGEATRFADESFDFAISEYGAALWADPLLWIPEAARILRPGGRLTLLTNSTLNVMCLPATEAEGAVTRTLLRPSFGMHKTLWPDAPGETEFHLNHGDWIELFISAGLIVKRLLELRPSADAQTRYQWADLEWARQWPGEEAWVVEKPAG